MRYSLSVVSILLLLLATLASAQGPGGDLQSLSEPLPSELSWRELRRVVDAGGETIEAELVSQRWQGTLWRHRLVVFVPGKKPVVRYAVVYIAGSGDMTEERERMRDLSLRTGTVSAVLGDVPNQPQLGGKKEDGLLAFGFLKFFETGDNRWPVLPAMVKSVRAAMGAIRALVGEHAGGSVERFILTGASKRGWTTWLTGLVDGRVAAIAPRVFDMVNIKEQVAWAAQHYGRQSERIKNYTELGLVERLNEPRGEDLLRLVDPISHLDRRQVPVLLLLGTNDPYWVVDSVSLYWSAIPGPKLIYQVPNAGHHLGDFNEVHSSFVAFCDLIAHSMPLPLFRWAFSDAVGRRAGLTLDLPGGAQSFFLRTATSKDRDFRDDTWREVAHQAIEGRRHLTVPLDFSGAPFEAFLGEVVMMTPRNLPLHLSTAVNVYP